MTFCTLISAIKIGVRFAEFSRRNHLRRSSSTFKKHPKAKKQEHKIASEIYS